MPDLQWIGGNFYLNMSQMQNNAKIIWGICSARGVTLHATAAMLGNMQTESSVNPNIWESLTPNPARGYGLTQWTPSTKLSDWSPGGYTNGTVQMQRIFYEAENGLQWFANPNAPIVNPPISFSAFLISTMDLTTLANYFLWYYEHPKDTIQPIRATQAAYWYEYLSGVEPPDPPEPPIGEFKKMKLIYYMGRKL